MTGLNTNLTKDPFHKAIVSSLTEGEEVLWSGKPKLKCYQKQISYQYTLCLIFLQVLILLGIVPSIIFPTKDGKKFIIQFTVYDLIGSAVVGGLMASPRKTPWEHYAVTSKNIRYAFSSQGNILTRRVGWEEIKSIKIREAGCDLLTITIKPYFLKGEVCTLDCLSQGYEVLAIITTYRPDLHDNRWFSE